MAALLIAFFAVLHMCNLAAGKNTQNALALLLVGMVAVFLGSGFATGHGSWSHFRSSHAHFGPMNWLLALIPVMFTYSGWNAAVYVSEEIHDSGRSIRPILLGGTSVVVVLYIALNALYLYAIPADLMRNSPNVAETAAQILFGAKSKLITPALIIALLGAISALTIAGPRVYFAMARDGAFIPAFARTHTRFETPALAIALQALWSISLVLLGGFERILMYTGFAILLSSGAAVAGLFFVQRRGSGGNRGQSIELLAPAVFVIASIAMVVDTIVRAPGIALVGVLLVAAGIPVYALCRRSSCAPCPLNLRRLRAIRDRKNQVSSPPFHRPFG